MPNVSLEVNELVSVSSLDLETKESYSSRVEDISPSGISIAWPTNFGVRVPFRNDEAVYISFVRKDAIYGFSAKVKQNAVEPIPILVIEQISETRRTQRRDFVRVPAFLLVELYEPTKPDQPPSLEEGAPAPLLRTNTIDISGGGFAFHDRQPISVGTEFEVQMSLPNLSPLRVMARCVRCEPRSDAKGNRIYRMGMMFTTIPESLRSKIVRYVFEAQKKVLSR
ncbi:MAG: PilZ domain-containing protein [Acidobacteriota bacterium]